MCVDHSTHELNTFYIKSTIQLQKTPFDWIPAAFIVGVLTSELTHILAFTTI